MRWKFLALTGVMIFVALAVFTKLSANNDEPVHKADVNDILVISSEDICRFVTQAPNIELATGQAEDELPIDIEITNALRLIDHNGERRNPENLFDQGLSLVFFGYASCEGVCLMAIPTIAQAAELIGAQARPILITIDPKRDTPDYLKSQLTQFSPDFIGLTGPDSALINARRMFNIQANPVFEDAKGTVFQHGSFIYLINSNAEVVSMLPPILPAEQIAQIARKYL